MAPPAQPGSWVREYYHFDPVYLDHNRRPPETPFLPNPDSNTPKKKSLLKSPIAASPKPVKFYSQYRCPICDATIAEKHDANFIGNVPCLHRATCTNRACIRAYYGTKKMWASPYTNKRVPLHCQAAGCEKPIEGWCLVRAVMGNESVFGIGQPDPEMQRKAREEELKEEERKEREEKKKEKKKEKERQKVALGDTLGSSLCECCFYGTFCCCCCVWISLFSR